LVCAVWLAVLAVGTATVHAQVPADDGPVPATTGPPGTDEIGTPAAGGSAVIGTLTTPAGPAEGTRIVVTAAGAPVGEVVTAPDGSFRVPVPSSGTYEVRLDTGTLPEGVRLAPGARDTLERVVVFEGREKRIVFGLVTADAAPEEAGPGAAERIANLAVSGLRYGLVVALCALGLTLIYATTGLINFAHGELVTFGALIAFWLSSGPGPGVPLVLAAVIALAVGGAFGALQDSALWEPLRRRHAGNVATIVISIGVSLLLRNLYLVIFGGNPRAYAEFATQEALALGFVDVRPKELVSIAVCALALLGTAALLRFSKLGTAVRAVADEPDLARASGIAVRRVVLAVWVTGAALAGLGGTMLGLTEGVQWNMGLRVLLVVFAAVVVGGFGSPAGAMLGGILIGVVSEVSTYWFPTDFKDVFALVALVVVLLIRPEGILGVRARVG
jgi:neutral amino acid transport system permease protein